MAALPKMVIHFYMVQMQSTEILEFPARQQHKKPLINMMLDGDHFLIFYCITVSIIIIIPKKNTQDIRIKIIARQFVFNKRQFHSCESLPFLIVAINYPFPNITFHPLVTRIIPSTFSILGLQSFSSLFLLLSNHHHSYKKFLNVQKVLVKCDLVIISSS